MVDPQNMEYVLKSLLISEWASAKVVAWFPFLTVGSLNHHLTVGTNHEHVFAL